MSLLPLKYPHQGLFSNFLETMVYSFTSFHVGFSSSAFPAVIGFEFKRLFTNITQDIDQKSIYVYLRKNCVSQILL